MENATQGLTKVKAEMVTEMVWAMEQRDPAVHKYGFPATVGVKIMNAVREVTVKQESEYDDGKYTWRTKLTRNGPLSSWESFKELGVEPDFSGVVAAYMAALPAKQEAQRIIERERLTARWTGSWAHAFAAKFNSMSAGSSTIGAVVHPKSLEEFFKGKQEIKVALSYNGDADGVVTREKVGGRGFSGTGGEEKFVLHLDYKRVNYSSAENLVKKYRERMAEKASRKDSNEASKAAHAKKVREDTEFLTACAPEGTLRVEEYKEWYRPPQWARGAQSYDYKAARYFVKVGDRDVAIAVAELKEKTVSLSGIVMKASRLPGVIKAIAG